jgi:hypothetical protein
MRSRASTEPIPIAPIASSSMSMPTDDTRPFPVDDVRELAKPIPSLFGVSLRLVGRSPVSPSRVQGYPAG